MKLRGSPNMGVGLFSKLVIFLLKIRPPHTQLYLCNHAVFCNASLSCSCLCNNSKWCLSSSVSRSSCTVLLLWCFLLHNPMYYIINRWAYFWEKSILCNNFIQRRVGLFMGDYGTQLYNIRLCNYWNPCNMNTLCSHKYVCGTFSSYLGWCILGQICLVKKEDL